MIASAYSHRSSIRCSLSIVCHRMIWLCIVAIVSVALNVPTNAAEGEKQPVKFRSDIDKFEQADAIKMPPAGSVLFVGSSSIRKWHSRLAEDFSDRDVIGRGFGGSTMKWLLYYFDEVVVPYQPSIIVVYEGDNDLNGATTVEEVTRHFDEFIQQVNEQLPEASIVFIPPKPSIARWKLWSKMEQFNSYLQGVSANHKSIWYADIVTPMLETCATADQPPAANLFVSDGLHLSDAGYDLWTRVVEETLVKIEKQRKH